MIVRNASGNDYQSQTGSTSFRFQQPAVSGPAPGQPREAVMDLHPWTYQIMSDEIGYWYLDRSTAAMSAQPGTARDYAIVSLNTSSVSGSTVAVNLRLSGSATWYRSDMGSGAPLYTGGLGRTVVKLPAGWEAHRITGVQLAVYPASAALSLRVHSFKVLGLTSGFQLVRIATPAPKTVAGEIAVPDGGGGGPMSERACPLPGSAGLVYERVFVVRLDSSFRVTRGPTVAVRLRRRTRGH